MLSRVKQVQLAAVAALAVMFTANASLSPANAQKAGPQIAQVEKQDSKGSSSNSDRGSARAGNSGAGRTSGNDGMKGSSNNDRGMTSQRSTRSNDGDRTSTRRTTVRSGNDTTVRTRSSGSRDYSNNRSSRDYSNNRSNRRVYYRGGRSSNTVAFVVLGPRAVYRSYGSGWCRALHSGRHFAPRVGWHRGRHVGAVRCG